MGHLGRMKEAYRDELGQAHRDLASRLQQGTVALVEPRAPAAWQAWREILELLFTPEDAALAARLPVLPTPLEALAERLGVPAAELRPRLDALCEKGLVMDLPDRRTGRVLYLLAPPVIGFFEFSLMRAPDPSIPRPRLAEAMDAYMHGDDAFAREALGGPTAHGRALVHETALSDAPLPDVLPWERAGAVVGEAGAWAVSTCYCRHKAEHLGRACDAPREICLSLGQAATYVARRGFGRAIERSEALDLLEQARAHGLVHTADNVRDEPGFVCNCCGCCCELLGGISRLGLPAVNPSGFTPCRDAARCAGCSRCARACPVGAITMRPERRPGEQRNALAPEVDLDACIGCGVCADACHKRALRMARRAVPRVPANAVEKAVRMALERDRLADLLVDAGAGLGSRFLHHAVRALTRLPVAEQLLATEQVRSRFVKAALAMSRPRA